MREIKFRAWDLQNKCWVYFPDQCGYEDTCFMDLVDRPAYAIMQFTGLKDKNGKEIYEGDIVHLGGDGSVFDDSGNWWDASGFAGYEGPIQLVEWNVGYAGFFPFAKYDSDCGVSYDASKMEILGNIHENPEMLK